MEESCCSIAVDAFGYFIFTVVETCTDTVALSSFAQAYDYVAWKVARAMPALPPFGNAYSDALSATGYKYLGGGSYPEPSLFVRLGYQWVGYSLFDAGNNLQRNASDALLEPSPNLLIKTRHTVRVSSFF